ADEDAQPGAPLARAFQLLHLAQADADREPVALDRHRVGGARARCVRARHQVVRQLAQVRAPARAPVGPAHACVPPTVRPSMRTVGSPTPTGTACASSPASMKVLVMRGMGRCAKLSRRPLPVTGIFMSAALSRSWR